MKSSENPAIQIVERREDLVSGRSAGEKRGAVHGEGFVEVLGTRRPMLITLVILEHHRNTIGVDIIPPQRIAIAFVGGQVCLERSRGRVRDKDDPVRSGEDSATGLGEDLLSGSGVELKTGPVARNLGGVY